MLVTAKRLGWDESLTPEQEFDLDDYDHESDDLAGELEVVQGHVPGVGEIKVYLVGGQEADPETIRPAPPTANAFASDEQRMAFFGLLKGGGKNLDKSGKDTLNPTDDNRSITPAETPKQQEPKMDAATQTKQPHEMTKQEWKEAHDAVKHLPWEQRKEMGFLSAGYGGDWEKGIEMAIEADKPVPQEIIDSSANLIAAVAARGLEREFGKDYRAKLQAAAAVPIREVVRRNEDGSLTVRRTQLSGGGFHDHKKGEVVVHDGKPMIVAKVGKPYRGRHDGETTGYFQEVTVREPKKAEVEAARRAVAAKQARDQGMAPGNESYPDLKKKQAAEYVALVRQALGGTGGA